MPEAVILHFRGRAKIAHLLTRCPRMKQGGQHRNSSQGGSLNHRNARIGE